MRFWMVLALILTLGMPSAAWALEWRELYLASEENGYFYRTTSELDDPGPREFGRYGGHNLFDRNRATCWAEGKPGPGWGEAVYVGVRKGERTINLLNGYHKSQALFMKNNRVKTLVLSMYVAVFRPDKTTELFTGYDIARFGHARKATLNDSMKTQAVRFPWDWSELEWFMDEAYDTNPHSKMAPGAPEELRKKFLLRMEIADTYPGTQYDDTCISEFWMSR